jgi:hypothetical protein
LTLTARREPTFDGAAHHSHHDEFTDGATPHGAAKPTGFLRFASTVQIVGSLLAVPVGLASAYSVYRANFSPETTCQTLRGNIIGMLDKSVDATTRRMLVRRDVEAFEQSCASVDPDAHAAFKRLLAVDMPAVLPVAAPVSKRDIKPDAKPAAKVETKAEAKAEPKAESKTERKIESKAEARPEAKAEAKTEAKTEAKAEAKAAATVEPKAEALATPAPVQFEPAISDTRWLAAVRQALTKHEPERAVSEELASPSPVLQPAWIVPAAPQLPPPQMIPAVSHETPANVVDHPVTPEPIPPPPPVDLQMAGGRGSRLGHWIAQIPFVGRAIER